MFEAPLADQIDVAGWKKNARRLLQLGVPPDQVRWNVAGETGGAEQELFAGLPIPQEDGQNASPDIKVSKDLLSLINTALLHHNDDRFDLAYRLMFRAQSQKNNHRNPVDPDVKKLNQYVKSVKRDIHKMHAFVRFRKVSEIDDREQFVAWFEPEHHIVNAVGPFFRNRFTGMDWLIMTPTGSIAWNGEAIASGPGGRKEDVPADDNMETEWNTYYCSIFNPARVKIQAMKSEMPMKYWKNLPEADLLPGLIEQASSRVDAMVGQDAPTLPPKELIHSDQPIAANLDDLYHMLENRTDFPSNSFSQRLVRGEGPLNADIMLVGEQPGDIEDQSGKPFVGSAGKMLDKALERVGIDRQRVFLTNAVKRFKYTPRGKRRIHQTPSAADITYYRWWLEEERRLVQPRLTVALGATAARSLVGKPVKISRFRGLPMTGNDGLSIMITIHPLFLLRIPDAQGQEVEYEKFVRELKVAAQF